MIKAPKRILVFLLAGSAALGLFALAGCKKEVPAPASEMTEKPMATTVLSADPLYTVLGKTDADISGAADIQIGDDAVTVNYHYYLDKEQVFDKTFGPHIAPKIRELYAKVKEIDTVYFDVFVTDLGAELWKPRLHFAVDRKMIVETDWTKLLDDDFFQVVKDLKTFD
ncbi:MAG: hypothetical protein NTW38_13015 [Candidatus Aminicenantes bacterium]|nr:hypothetical protein [Candidatus Aminicenantes bacterium]